MLLSTRNLLGYTIAAKDGNVGSASDFLFDDQTWLVRYLVVDTGNWLPGRKVLLHPRSLGQPSYLGKMFPVELTREQIESSPPLAIDEPVSRQHEHAIHVHYAWPAYWGGAALGQVSAATETDGDSHLRSVKEVCGYHINARDGSIGHVEDFIVDDEEWYLRYLAVDTKNWLPGRKVLIAPAWAKEISWSERCVEVDRLQEEVKASPEFNPNDPVNREYEQQLYDYYGKPHYWTGN